MPKEIVFRNEPDNITLDGETYPAKFGTQVTWDRNGNVQITTVARYFKSVKTWEDTAGFVDESSWWITMDRDQINKLIKVLRKARDQALGRDA